MPPNDKPKKSKAERHAEKAAANKTRNEMIRANKKDREETLQWFDCVVASALITKTRTVLDVQSDSGVDKVTFAGVAHLRKGDILKVLVEAGREVREKPEFDEAQGIWKKPSDEVYLVERSLHQEEEAIEIKVLDGEGVVLCHYDGSE